MLDTLLSHLFSRVLSFKQIILAVQFFQGEKMSHMKSWLMAAGLSAASLVSWATDITGAGATFLSLCTANGLKPTKRNQALA